MSAPVRLKDYQEEVINLYQIHEWSINRIAKHFSVHHSTVNRFLKQTVGVRPVGMTPEQKQAIYEAYQNGYSRREIAKRFNTDASNVSRILLREFGVQPGIHRNPSPYQALIPLFISDYQQGLSASQIAAKYQTTHNTVLKHLRQYKESIRSLEEIKRLPDLNLEYFHHLTPEKIFQLGQIWAIGSLRTKREYQLVLSIDSARDHRLEEVVAGWADISSRCLHYNQTNSCALKIGSISLCQQFEQWGIRQTYPQCLEPNHPEFWKGYLSLKTGFHRNSLYIGMSKGFEDSFKQELFNFLCSLGIEAEAIHCRRHGFSIFRKGEVLKVLAFMPQLLKQVPQEELNPYWEAFLKETKTHSLF